MTNSKIPPHLVARIASCSHKPKIKTSVRSNKTEINRFKAPLHDGLITDKRALSTAVSTVILTGAIVLMVLVSLNFANAFLNSRIVENEFSAAKQFMQTVGLQIDDVTWTIGRTQTIRYASQYGQVNFEPSVLKYTVYVDKGGGYAYLTNYSVGVILFNMPLDKYSLGNNYYERIFPSSDGSFLQKGTSAPVSFVYVIEKLPMSDGSFLRVAVAPSIRMLNSTISTSVVKNYFKFYLPVLEQGSNPLHSQTVTIVGNSVSFETESFNTGGSIKINATFPKANLGFDENFFKFSHVEETVYVPGDSIIEFYTGEVTVSLGLHF